MEKNANRIFQHTDSDGDWVEVIQATKQRLTVEVTQRGDGSSLVYVTRDAAAVLRDALSAWLGDDVAADTTAPETPTAAGTVTAEHRARALEAVSRMAPSGAEPGRMLDAADDVAYWLATGERRPVEVPSHLRFIDATSCGEPRLCPHCTHAYHGTVGCGEGGRGMHRCRCNGVLR